MKEGKRGQAQLAADVRYEVKRAEQPRYGGRCSQDEKDLLSRLACEQAISEKELVFKALRFFDENHKKGIDLSDVR